MLEVKLRPAVPDDAEAMRGCIAAAYADAMRDIDDLPDVTGGIRDDIAVHHVILAEDDAHLLGLIVFGRKADAMMIFNLAVSPKAQGRGIARQLLAAAEVVAAGAGLSVLRLRTHRLMTGTCAMYRHLGWTDAEAKGNTIMMEKRL